MHAAAKADNDVAVAAGMDVVHECFHINRIACVLVGRIRVVAGDAILDVRPRAAMKLEAVMTGVTGVVVDNLAFKQGCTASGYEIVYAIGRYRCLATNLDTQSMRFDGIKNGSARVGRQRVCEGVRVSAIAIIDESAGCGGLRVGLCIRNAIAAAGDIGLPGARAAARTGRKLRDREAGFAGSQTLQALAQVIGQGQALRSGRRRRQEPRRSVTSILILSADAMGRPVPVVGPGGPGGPAGPAGPAEPSEPSLPPLQAARARASNVREIMCTARFLRIAIVRHLRLSIAADQFTAAFFFHALILRCEHAIGIAVRRVGARTYTYFSLSAIVCRSGGHFCRGKKRGREISLPAKHYHNL